jgi:N-acetylmuramoyl-L-alanine amidase
MFQNAIQVNKGQCLWGEVRKCLTAQGENPTEQQVKACVNQVARSNRLRDPDRIKAGSVLNSSGSLGNYSDQGTGWMIPSSTGLKVQNITPTLFPAVFNPRGNKLRVCLDAGHGGHDSGACGKNTQEDDLTLKTVLYAKRLLEECGVEVVLTRDQDRFVSLGQRAAMSRGCDAFVSVHFDGAEDSRATGFHTIYENSGSRVFAKTMMASMGQFTNRKKRPLSNPTGKEAPLKVLAEGGFITNGPEERWLRKGGYKQVAEGIVHGILKHHGMIDTPRTMVA